MKSTAQLAPQQLHTLAGGLLVRVQSLFDQAVLAVARSCAEGGKVQNKLLSCRSAEIVTREALQIHGGMGYAEESPVSRYFVNARVLSIFEGAEETLARKVTAQTLLEGALAP